MDNFYKNGLEFYPKKIVIINNILLLIYFSSALIGLSAIRFRGFPILSIAFFFFILLFLLILTLKFLCTRCFYYDKFCAYGWGKLSSLFFKKNTRDNNIGGKLSFFSWIVTIFVPFVMIPISIIFYENFLIIGITCIFLCFISISLFFILRKRICLVCKRRDICIASSARK